MTRWLGFVFVLFVLSCSTIRVDPSVSATGAGFPTAEGVVLGERFRGLRVVSVQRGQSLADLGFKIQGLFSGTVKIDSANCQINETVRYSESELIPVLMDKPATLSCVISFLVSPEYPNQKNNPIVVSSFKGALAIRVLDGEAWMGKSLVVPNTSDEMLVLDLKEQNPVRAVFYGCGIEYSEKLYPEEDGTVLVRLNDLMVNTETTCVLSGLIISSEYEDLLIDVFVARHSDSFIDLPKPVVKFKKDKLCVEADPTVSFIMTDKQTSNCLEKCFDNPSFIRGVTVKGRSFLGVVKDGGIEWK